MLTPTALQEQPLEKLALHPASLRLPRLSPPAPLMHPLTYELLPPTNELLTLSLLDLTWKLPRAPAHALLTLGLLILTWKLPRAPAPEPPAGLEPPPTPEYQPELLPQSVSEPSAMKKGLPQPAS